MLKKIEVYIDGVYGFTTTRYKTIRELKKYISDKETLFVAGRGNLDIKGKKITAKHQ